MAQATPQLSIVVAEDDDIVRSMFTTFLEQSGHSVIAVTRGDDALDAIRTRHPDVAIVDQRMPGLNGLDVVRTARADHSLDGTRLVVFSSSARRSDVAAGFAAGADDIIEAPLDLDDVERRVRRRHGPG